MITKITVKLPIELKRRTKALADLRGETVSEVVREALHDYIADAMEEAEDVRAIREIEARIARGEEPVSDWEAFENEMNDS